MPRNLLDQDRIRERNLKNAKQIEQGEIKVGDVVFDSLLLKNVMILDLPDPKKISMYNYRAFPYIRNYCKTINGKVECSEYGNFVKISKGNYYSTHEIRGKGKKLEDRAWFCGIVARQEGLRVAKEKTKEGYLLKFFGDSQQEVDDFLEDAKYTFEEFRY